MAGKVRRKGVTVVPVSGGLALFGDAGSAASGLDAAALAEAAGEQLRSLLGRAVPVLYARQEHTRLTFAFGGEAPATGPHCVSTCDALLTAEPAVALCVRTADCLPVALAGGGVVAMVHAGWRGLAADILGATVSRFSAEFGVDAGGIEAVIGVGVGPCHYPVGEEVILGLARHAADGERWRGDGRVDLAAYARGRLLSLGLAPERVTVLPGCTACSTEYHSCRRDGGRAGRQWSAVILT